ncbi:MAG: hypothetical protein HYV35_00025 [Lentisphaerae bacterium]|nr:hypothetical protein [Lentisphaerota bacterium]
MEDAFARYKKLPLGSATAQEIDYEGRQLITGELVEQMKVKLPLLENGFSAVSFYREEIESACQIRGTHAVLAPLIQKFLEEVLFAEKTTLFDTRLCARLADADVREHVRAVFIPLIRRRTTRTEARTKAGEPGSVSAWLAFQVTHSHRRPAEPAEKTPFNLVPCNRALEVTFTHWIDKAQDTAAFCKNAGPQCLRIDYLAEGGRPAFYTPDFIVRKTSGNYLLVETKGREDRDVPAKAKTAASWCKAASTKKVQWEYLYVAEGVFERVTGNSVEELERVCAPALVSLMEEKDRGQLFLTFEKPTEERIADEMAEFIGADEVAKLPSATAARIGQAVQLFRHFEHKPDLLFSPVFTPLQGPLDKYAKDILLKRLGPDIPKDSKSQKDFFDPYMNVSPSRANYLRQNAQRLQKALLYDAAIMPISLLKFCLEYESSPVDHIRGIFEFIRRNFRDFRATGTLKSLKEVYDFRNTYVAHQDVELRDVATTRDALKKWIALLLLLHPRSVRNDEST